MKPRAPSLLYKQAVKVHTYNASTWELEAGGSGAQGHPWLPTEFKASLQEACWEEESTVLGYTPVMLALRRLSR